MPVVLFHGPGAAEKASEEAKKGRLLAPPFGAEGLKIKEAREIVALMSEIPLGDQQGVFIVGPLDLASPSSSDVLLKVLEDSTGDPQPILWAVDIGRVRPTVRSRCLLSWCPGDESTVLEEEARRLLEALSQDKVVDVVSLVKKHASYDLLKALARELAKSFNWELWVKLRRVCVYKKPTVCEILDSLL